MRVFEDKSLDMLDFNISVGLQIICLYTSVIHGWCFHFGDQLGCFLLHLTFTFFYDALSLQTNVICHKNLLFLPRNSFQAI